MDAPLLLPPAQAGPYLRALRAALDAAAPDRDWPDLAAAALHLRLLDPALSGPLFAPAELDPISGLPAHAWLERAAAARRTGPATPEAAAHLDALVTRAAGLDPAREARLAARQAVARLAPGAPVLAALHSAAVLVRDRRPLTVGVAVDRRLPTVGWVRMRAELVAGPGDRLAGIRRDGEGVRVEPGLAALLQRHATSPLAPAAATLAAATGGRVLRLCRGTIGPFWFPGLARPPGIPVPVAATLVLHLQRACLGTALSGHVHGDSLRPADPPPPPGLGLHTERHLVAHRSGAAAVAAWQPQLAVTAFG